MTLEKFLISCSGADKNILDQCPTEKNKYYGVGSTVLLTSLLAMLSGGYALYFTFQSIPIAITLGIFWGIVIFSLDRYIVSSIKKVGDFKKEFLIALPRVLMTLVLAITISKPLELRLFQDAIEKKMGEISDESIASCEKSWKDEMDSLTKRKSQLEDLRKVKSEEIYSKDGIFKSLSDDITRLVNDKKRNESLISQNARAIYSGTSYYNEQIKDGSIRRVVRRTQAAINAIASNRSLKGELAKNNFEISDIESQVNSRKKLLQGQVETAEKQYTSQIEGAQKQIDDHNNRRAAFSNDCATRSKNARDIPARLEALSKITNGNSSISMASWLITLLFILLETAPVLVKLLTTRGPYDEILDRIEYEEMIRQKMIISNLNANINTEMNISTERNKIKLDAELRANESLMKEIANAQSEIAKETINRWKREEIEKIYNQPVSPGSTTPPQSQPPRGFLP